MRALPPLPTTLRAPLARRRLLAAALAAPLLPACGFRPRGAPSFVFGALFLNAPQGSPLAQELGRHLESSGTPLRVIREGAQMPLADAIFDLQTEQHERAVAAYNSAGQVRELQLRLRVRFRLRTPKGLELIEPTELVQTRDVSYNETQALAKEAEEALLMRNMQTDIVQQLIRRLAAVREPGQ